MRITTPRMRDQHPGPMVISKYVFGRRPTVQFLPSPSPSLSVQK